LRGEETPTMEDLGYAFGGGLPYVVGGHALAGANKSMQRLTGSNFADRLERKAIGARPAGVTKSLKQKGLSATGEIALEESIKRVGETGIYKDYIGDPRMLKIALEQQMDELGKKINPEVARLEKLRQEMAVSNPIDIEVLNAMQDYNSNQIALDPNPNQLFNDNPQFDGSGIFGKERLRQQAEAIIPDVAPDWVNRDALFERYRGGGGVEDVKGKASSRLEQIQNEVDLNTLTGLNKSREALNYQIYGAMDPIYVNDLSDALRSDVRTALMKGAESVDPNSPLKDLLKDYGDRADIVKKVLNTQLGQDSLKIPTPRNWWKTTGGFGVPIALAAGGNPYLAAGALGLSALLETPTGQLMLADILRNNKMSGIPGAVQKGFLPTQQTNILMREDQ
jgi:hypothetical protein